MPQAQWKSAADGSYWIDVDIAGRNVRLMIDLGLVDSLQQVAFEIDPLLFDSLDQTGALSQLVKRTRRDASGRLTRYSAGQVTAQLIEPLSRQRIGPQVSVFAGRGDAGVPNRVGVLFFHHLIGCRAIWDFDQQIWTIDYP